MKGNEERVFLKMKEKEPRENGEGKVKISNSQNSVSTETLV